jgi:hypothetical protein
LKSCFKFVRLLSAAAFLTFSLTFAFGQGSSAPDSPPAAPAVAPASGAISGAVTSTEPNDDRIFGVIPNFLTVENPQPGTAPLTPKQKFALFAKETFDPFTFAESAAGAGVSQAHNGDPVYGRGSGAYADRFGAAFGDVATQNFFSDFLLASWLHEDPRYFRRGPEFSFWNRVGYAISRVVVTRTDSGRNRFNFSGILGMSMGIALSNAYYPDPSVNGAEVGSRFGTSLAASAVGNLLPEFWPDIREKLARHKPHLAKPPQTTPGG